MRSDSHYSDKAEQLPGFKEPGNCFPFTCFIVCFAKLYIQNHSCVYVVSDPTFACPGLKCLELTAKYVSSGNLVSVPRAPEKKKENHNLFPGFVLKKPSVWATQ